MHSVSRVASVLNSKDYLTLVYDTRESRSFSLALRLSRALSLYLGFDSEMLAIAEFEAASERGADHGNLVFIGSSSYDELLSRLPKDAYRQPSTGECKTINDRLDYTNTKTRR